MKCLQCGYCCITSWVVVIDPKIVTNKLDFFDLTEEDVISKESGIECPHLEWKEGKAHCKIHHYAWFKHTPCASHGQIEASPETLCRMGAYLREKNTDGREWVTKELTSQTKLEEKS